MIDPDLITELRRLETALASRSPREVDGGLAALIADDFVEHGSSGSVLDAATTRRMVERDAPHPVVIEGFEATELAPGVVLATYRMAEPKPSNRVSIWVRRDRRWLIRFHQGTLRPG